MYPHQANIEYIKRSSFLSAAAAAVPSSIVLYLGTYLGITYKHAHNLNVIWLLTI